MNGRVRRAFTVALELGANTQGEGRQAAVFQIHESGEYRTAALPEFGVVWALLRRTVDGYWQLAL